MEFNNTRGYEASWLKIKKMDTTEELLEDMAKLFYFMTFIHKFHILATRGKKQWDFVHFWIHFGHFGGLPDWKWIKWMKWKSFVLSIPF